MSKKFIEVNQPKDGVQVLKSCIKLKSQTSTNPNVLSTQLKRDNSIESREKHSRLGSNQNILSHHNSSQGSDENQLGSHKNINFSSERSVRFKDQQSQKQSTRQKLREQELKIMEFEKNLRKSMSPDTHQQQKQLVQQTKRGKEKEHKKKKSNNNLSEIIVDIEERSIEETIKEVKQSKEKQTDQKPKPIVYQKEIKEEQVNNFKPKSEASQKMQSSQSIQMQQQQQTSQIIKQEQKPQVKVEPKKGESKTKCSCKIF